MAQIAKNNQPKVVRGKVSILMNTNIVTWQLKSTDILLACCICRSQLSSERDT